MAGEEVSAGGVPAGRGSSRFAVLAEEPGGPAAAPPPVAPVSGNGNRKRVRSAVGRITRWLLVLAAVGGTATAGVVWGPRAYRQIMVDRERANSEGMDQLRFYEVVEKDLRIGVVEDGRLRATKHHNIQSELDGRSKIAWVVEEGKEVKKGDRLIEFEKKPVEERIENLKEQLKRAEGDLGTAEENGKIEESAGESAVAMAETRLEGARKGLKKYRELESPKRFKALQKAITDEERGQEAARDALNKALETLDEHMFDEENERKGCEAQVKKQRDALEAARKKVSGAVLAKKMFQAYDYPETLAEKKQAVSNAKLDLRKIRVAARSNLQKCRDAVTRARKNIENKKKLLEAAEKQLEKCVIKAPASGMVLYGNPRRRWHSSNEQKVKVGAEWWKGYTILTIPDFSKFEIDISIAEEYRGRVKPGCGAVVTLEAIPGLKLEGKLKNISNLATPRNRYDSSSPKVFKGVVELDANDKRMVSGMTTRVEIVAETVKGVLALPIESVFNEEGKPVVYLRKGENGFERRVVKPGRSNDDEVEITEGLAAGDEIWLIHPHRAGLPVSAGAGDGRGAGNGNGKAGK